MARFADTIKITVDEELTDLFDGLKAEIVALRESIDRLMESRNAEARSDRSNWRKEKTGANYDIEGE